MAWVLAIPIGALAAAVVIHKYLRCREMSPRGVFRCERWRWHDGCHEVHLPATPLRGACHLEWK